MRCKRFMAAVLAAVAFAPLYAQDAAEMERARQIIRYGTETEITALLQTLKAQKTEGLDGELTQLLRDTKSAAIQSAGIGFFTEREGDALASLTLEYLKNRDAMDAQVIGAALEYTARKGNAEAADVLMRIVESDELRYQNAALRALGKAAARGGGAEKEAVLKFLLDFYKNKAGSEEVRRLVIEAVGEGALPDASDFLREIIENLQESVTLRSQALAAAGKLGADGADAALRASVIAQLNAAEPLVRAAAVSALGAFPGDESDAALLDALRDPFFRTRLAAVKALSQRKLGSAVDFLVFRAKNDEAAAVREEAVKTLKAYASAQADAGLESIYDERRSGEKIRILAAEALVQNNAARYTKKLIADMEEAKRAKYKTLYAGLIKALSTSTAPEMAALAEALLASADTLDRAWAIEIIGNNKLKRFAPELRAIADDPKNGLRGKAKTALEKME